MKSPLDHEAPLFEQIVWRMKFAIASRSLRTETFVPSVRELSRQFQVNPNTVARAYRELQREGILQSVRGTGLQVQQDALEKCSRDCLERIRGNLRHVLYEIKQSGFSTDLIHILLEQETKLAT